MFEFLREVLLLLLLFTIMDRVRTKKRQKISIDISDRFGMMRFLIYEYNINQKLAEKFVGLKKKKGNVTKKNI